MIGTKFGKDGQLEVLSWDGERQGTAKVFTVKCHTCAKDPEMYGDAIFKATKAFILSGGQPCGCSHVHRHTREQYLLKIQRGCEKGGLTLLGFNEECDVICGQTKIRLLCNKHQYCWNTTKLSNFFRAPVNGNNSCIECSKEKVGKRSTKSIEEILLRHEGSGIYDNITFNRSENDKNKWTHTCKICSNDDYVKNGLCTGVFKTSWSTILNGGCSCRCSENYKGMTKSMRVHRIKMYLKENNSPYTFISHSRIHKEQHLFLLECPEHGIFEKEEYSILRGKGCQICSDRGYVKTKPSFIYLLKVSGKHQDFVGYGITTQPQIRITTHKNNLIKSGLVIDDCRVYPIPGEVAFDVELSLKQKYEHPNLDLASFKTEATHTKNYNSIAADLQAYDFYKMDLIY